MPVIEETCIGFYINGEVREMVVGINNPVK